MTLILRNITAGTLTYTASSLTIAPGVSATIPSATTYLVCGDPNVLSDIRASHLIVNDGTTDYLESDAIDYIDFTFRNIQRDTDGAQIVRVKASKAGWTYGAIPFEFGTSQLGSSLYAKDYLGTDRPGFTMKSYNSSDVEVTTAGVANVNLATICKTVIDFEPTFDYELIGGELRILSTLTDDLRLWIVAVPDIAAPTGSKEMAGGINLKYLTPSNVMTVDGRVTKLLSYNATYHTNKLRFIFKYTAALAETLAITLEMYRS